MKVKYENIKSLILEENWENSQVRLKFKTDEKNPPIETVGFIQADAAKLQKSMNKSMQKTMFFSTAISLITSLISRFFGGNPIAQTAGGVASMAAGSVMMSPGKTILTGSITPQKKEEAVINAFQGVATMYEYANGKWQFKGSANQTINH